MWLYPTLISLTIVWNGWLSNWLPIIQILILFCYVNKYIQLYSTFNLLNDYSLSNDIQINNSHSFSIDILFNVNRNTILNVYSIDNLIDLRENKNIKEVRIYCEIDSS